MNVVFDNIIFSLQKHGGISVVWYELLKRILEDSDIESSFIDIPNENFLRKKLVIPHSKLIEQKSTILPLKIHRYKNPSLKNAEGIFHSSYFRTLDNPKIANITTVHDFTYEYFFKGLPKLIHHQQKGRAINNSQAIICVSQNTKNDLLKFYPKVKEEQTRVVYNGVSEDYFVLMEVDKVSLRNLIPFESEEYILYVGDRRGEYKNFRMVVDACKISGLPLVIVGGGELTKNEQFIITQSVGINQFVQLSGLANTQLNLLYNNASWFVYPSAYEGFGIPILEAQKAGCPVICSNMSSIPEVAGKGASMIDNISATKIADILLQSQSRSELKNKIIKEGLVNSKRFSWDKCYQDTKQLYFDVYSRSI
jgi:glycosyltransferase involved in cell wall biosynthesis